MSYLEFFGTIFNLWAVWLTTRRSIWGWPIGLVGVVLYAFLFYQIQFYSDLIEQLYYVATGLFGWWAWLHPPTAAHADEKRELRVGQLTLRTNILVNSVTFAISLLWGFGMTKIDRYLPILFPEPASFPYLDAITTVFSFLAQWLMAKKKIECWILWIAVDFIGVGVYWAKGIKFVALEFVLFLVLAVMGYLNWKKELRRYERID